MFMRRTKESRQASPRMMTNKSCNNLADIFIGPLFSHRLGEILPVYISSI